jgi:hypothetical protein
VLELVATDAGWLLAHGAQHMEAVEQAHRWPHSNKEATYGTFPRALPPHRRDYSRMGEKAKKEDITTKE